MLKLVPGFDDEMIMALVKNSTTLKALVLEMYGTGNGPSRFTSISFFKINILKIIKIKETNTS